MATVGAVACGVPRPYSTPRTTPAGKISHSFAQQLGDTAFDLSQPRDELAAPDGYPGPATYTMRVGLSDRWDAAATMALLLVGGELKYNFVRSRFVDAAVAPRAQYYQPLRMHGMSRLTTLSLPVPLGINVTRRLTFVAEPALTYADAHTPSSRDVETEELKPAQDEQGFVGSFGTDLSVRLTPRIALQPGFTLFRPLAREDYRWQIGIGFNFGALPAMDP